MSNASSEEPKAKSQKLKANFGGPARVILSAFGIFIISQLVAAILLEIAFGIIRPGNKNILDQSAAAQFFYILLAESLAVGLVLLILRRRRLGLGAIGFGRRPAWRDLKWAAVGFVVFYGLLIFATVILTLLIPSYNTNALQDVGFNILSTPMDRVIAFVALVIIPPLGEETLMRGYLYSGLRSRLKFWPALLGTSLLFGAAHLSTGVSGALWAAGVDTFVLSVVLVYLRERSGALYAPILVHSLNNVVAFFAHYH
ncbi:MAG: type II CAAX endopeptidase family protein [bacterium]|nr:type II CAAX endopeptidase family protein [bacterium]